MGKLIVIDGLDGSGKQTQTDLLCERLQKEGVSVKAVHFPDYSQPSGQTVREYLDGKLGSLNDVNPYGASSLYAVDRYASFRKFWRQDYLAGTIILADRYVTSNLIHQTGKLPSEQWDAFGDWLTTFEYQLLGLPKPDAVFYLDVAPQVSRKLLEQRYQVQGQQADLHEQNLDYLSHCRECAAFAAKRYGWDWISCHRDGQMMPADTIARLLYHKACSVIQHQKE